MCQNGLQINVLHSPTHCLFSPLLTKTQRLLTPSDKLRTNIYLNPVICPKPKIGLFSFWIFSVGLSVCVCVCVRAISLSLFKLGTWNFAEMIMYTYTLNTFFRFSKFQFYNPQPTGKFLDIYLFKFNFN